MLPAPPCQSPWSQLVGLLLPQALLHFFLPQRSLLCSSHMTQMTPSLLYFSLLRRLILPRTPVSRSPGSHLAACLSFSHCAVCCCPRPGDSSARVLGPESHANLYMISVSVTAHEVCGGEVESGWSHQSYCQGRTPGGGSAGSCPLQMAQPVFLLTAA